MTDDTPRAPARITDSHCHLDFKSLQDDLDGVLARAHAAGVHRMVTIATTLKAVPEVAALAEAHPSVFFAAGVHPMHVTEEGVPTLEALIRLADHPKCVGLGETGLDYHYTRESAEAQKISLRTHITAARLTGLPLIIHARDADEDMARLLREGFDEGPYTCVMHCFSSGPELARAALDLGFYLSISGIAAFPKSGALRDIFAEAPLERLLVETDAPYLAPPPHRGKRNEPGFVALTAQAMAAHLGIDYARFAAATEANFERLFVRAA